MKFTVINSELAGRIAMVQRVVSSKNVLPILDNIIFTVKDGTLQMKAADTENSIMTQVTLKEAEGEAAFAVNAKDIAEAVKGIASEAEMTFEVEDETSRTLKVKYPMGMFTMPTEGVEEFPAHQEVSKDSHIEFTIMDTILMDNIGRTLFATAQDELRPVMNGIFFDLTEQGLKVVASDGHQLIRCTVTDIMPEKDKDGKAITGNFILPKKPAGIIRSILTKTGAAVTVRFDDRNLVFQTDEFTLHARLIEGRYPNYNSVIPQNNTNIMTVNRQSMLAALKRVTPFANNSSCLVSMQLSENTICLEAEDYDFSKTATEHVACDYSGQPMKIGFKGVSLIGLLANVESEEVRAELADPSRAGLFLPAEQPEGQEILMLQMPMLIND